MLSAVTCVVFNLVVVASVVRIKKKSLKVVLTIVIHQFVAFVDISVVIFMLLQHQL
jgi:hypothetical protein